MSQLAKLVKKLEEGDELIFNDRRLKFVDRVKTYTRSNMLFRFEIIHDYSNSKFETGQLVDFSRNELFKELEENCYRIDENIEAEKHLFSS